MNFCLVLVVVFVVGEVVGALWEDIQEISLSGAYNYSALFSSWHISGNTTTL